MSMIALSEAVLAAAALVAVVSLVSWMVRLQRMPRLADPAPAKGSGSAGVVYSFTLGMLPWRKESTSQHWPDYLRGVLFHIGIAAALVALVASLWWQVPGTAFGTVAGGVMAAGLVSGGIGLLMRATKQSMRALSRPDDYASPVVVELFVAAALAFVAGAAGREFLYFAASLMLLYIPMSKIRHAIYFFYSRPYFGRLFGRRGVICLAHSPGR